MLHSISGLLVLRYSHNIKKQTKVIQETVRENRMIVTLPIL